jgi:hypothetical protein
MYDVGERGWLLGCRWVLGSGVRTVGSWLEASVREMVFWCVEYELIGS